MAAAKKPHQTSQSGRLVPTEPAESLAVVEAAFSLARTLGIQSYLIQADLLADVRAVERLRGDGEHLIWLTQSDETRPAEAGDSVIHLPDAALSRVGQITMGLFLAVVRGTIPVDESLVCLSGVVGSRRIDTMLVANPKRVFPWLDYQLGEARELLVTETFARTLTTALRLAAEGREGKPLGTILVLGDPDELEPHVRQLILNPCVGHPKRVRNLHNPEFIETLRELAAMDGAIVVHPKGIVESAGTYLTPAVRGSVSRGTGARHASAAGLTASAKCVAVVVSSSSGSVTVFHEGKAVLTLERPTPSFSSTRRR